MANNVDSKVCYDLPYARAQQPLVSEVTSGIRSDL